MYYSLSTKMSPLGILFVCLSVVACSASQVNRIVGGEATTVEKYPIIVQVEHLIGLNVFSQMCAGSVLTRRTILSAAHCFDVSPTSQQRYRIRAGSSYRSVGGIIRQVAIIFNHPTWGLNDYDGDATLLYLESPLEYTDVIKQATIVASGFVAPDNLPITHIGWGMTDFPGDRAEVLQEVNVFSINNDLCRERYEASVPPRVVTTNMICAGLIDVGGKGPCWGDSGGPVFFENIVIGIVAFGEGCANKTTPGVNTAVSSYTEWIVANAI
ncbi:PREDICTED: trypsin CFT-1-like [Papilio polytes]|uniref:trypsin CFT-1-like n=1 Tax=Papilio polytes TaxID=76194 RepID=UPI0006760211|nr:PREDICTED: trypsin CFT-1-like [Papilio polytes]